jgi:cysteine desulfurase/selenocysteine lyase
VRGEFPVLRQKVHGKPLVWMDNAATTQKPQAVIDALARFYERDYSNIHRGAHTLAARATEAYESAREKVRRFLGAGSAEDVIFVRGTTEAINLVAKAWGRKHVGAGDEILLTQLEHHANIVPWQMLAREVGARIVVAPINDRGDVIMEEYARLLNPRTKIVAFAHVSNALGTVLPAAEMIAAAHRHGVPVLVDGAQSVPHTRVDVLALGADFYVFSGHKVYAPAGVGALYATRAMQEAMPPWQGGGNMIQSVTFEETVYAPPPAKFEAGTPTIGDAVGLGAAIDWVDRIGIDTISRHEHRLTDYAMEGLATVPGIRLIGTSPTKVSVLSFVLEGARVEDVGRYLDSEGIAVRAGHHCAMPTMQRYGVTGTVRPSLAVYNTHEDVDRLVEALKRYRHA